MKRFLAGSVIALALGATSVTRADPATAPLPEQAAVQAVDTPLHVRPSKPLALEPSAPPLAAGWKVSAIALAAGGTGFWLWKRRAVRFPLDGEIPELRIVRRMPVGARSELLLVDFEGQRMLLGVTPHTIQNLFIITPEDPPSAENEAPSTFAGRLADILEPSELAVPASPPAPRQQASKNAKRAAHAPVEGQVRGLVETGEPK